MKYECEYISICTFDKPSCTGIEIEEDRGIYTYKICPINANYVRLCLIIDDWDIENNRRNYEYKKSWE